MPDQPQPPGRHAARIAAAGPRRPGRPARAAAPGPRRLRHCRSPGPRRCHDRRRSPAWRSEVAELAETGGARTKPIPSWLWSTPPGELTPGRRRLLLEDLIVWLDHVYLRFPDGTLPECWLWHPDVVEELLWLRRGVVAAYRGPGAIPAACRRLARPAAPRRRPPYPAGRGRLLPARRTSTRRRLAAVPTADAVAVSPPGGQARAGQRRRLPASRSSRPTPRITPQGCRAVSDPGAGATGSGGPASSWPAPPPRPPPMASTPWRRRPACRGRSRRSIR